MVSKNLCGFEYTPGHSMDGLEAAGTFSQEVKLCVWRLPPARVPFASQRLRPNDTKTKAEKQTGTDQYLVANYPSDRSRKKNKILCAHNETLISWQRRKNVLELGTEVQNEPVAKYFLLPQSLTESNFDNGVSFLVQAKTLLISLFVFLMKRRRTENRENTYTLKNPRGRGGWVTRRSLKVTGSIPSCHCVNVSRYCGFLPQCKHRDSRLTGHSHLPLGVSASVSEDGWSPLCKRGGGEATGTHLHTKVSNGKKKNLLLKHCK